MNTKTFKAREMEREKQCKDMIISVVTYGGTTDINRLVKDRYLAKYVSEFGEKQVRAWLKDVLDRIDHIELNVYEDSEGCTYNSVVWKKGMEPDE